MNNPEISVVVPMFNEEENVENTVQRISTVLNENFRHWELIVVDDGSSDSTQKLAKKKSEESPNIYLYRHPINFGVGRALKTGFSHVKGNNVVTIDADLSYEESGIPKLIDRLNSGDADVVLGSPYTEEGETVNVPFHRLLISKAGNYFLRFILGTKIKCLTSIFRAYRREVIETLDLTSDGKDIEPEIVAKATAMGFRIVEVPAQLRGRTRGQSKFKFGESVWMHLKFSLYERPMILFNVVGVLILLFGVIIGLDLVWKLYIEQQQILRPSLLLAMLLSIIGIQTMVLGFLADQLTLIKSSLLRNRREIRKRSLSSQPLYTEV